MDQVRLFFLSRARHEANIARCLPEQLSPSAHVYPIPVSMVVNTHPHNQPGEHQLALFLAYQNHTEFFDSCAYPSKSALFPEGIMALLKHNIMDIAFQRKQLQYTSPWTALVV